MPRSPLITSLLHPLNLSMLALSAAAGLCAAWWMAPIGLLFWLVMVAVIARDPGLQITFINQSRQPLAPRFQTRFDHLDRARVSIFNQLSLAIPPVRKVMEPLQTALDDLVNHTYQLCIHMSALDNNYSVQKISNNPDDDIARMQKNINTATDPAARKEFEQTLQSLQSRQVEMKKVDTLLSRFEAQMTGINSAVDGVVTGVVSLQGRNAGQVEDKIPALLKIIQTEQDELQHFDSELANSSAG